MGLMKKAAAARVLHLEALIRKSLEVLSHH